MNIWNNNRLVYGERRPYNPYVTIKTVQGPKSMSHTTRPKGARCMLPELYLGLKASYCSVYILPRSKIQILLRTVWEETRVAALPSSPPKQSSVKFGFCSSVKYKLNSTRPLGRVTVQWAYNEPLWGKLYVIWMLSHV